MPPLNWEAFLYTNISYHLLDELELSNELEANLYPNVLNKLEEIHDYLLENPFLEIDDTKGLEILHLSFTKFYNDLKYLLNKEISILFPRIKILKTNNSKMEISKNEDLFITIDTYHQSFRQQLDSLIKSIKLLIKTNKAKNALSLLLKNIRKIENAVLHIIYIEQTFLLPKLRSTINE